MKYILFLCIITSLYSTFIAAGGDNPTIEKNRQALIAAKELIIKEKKTEKLPKEAEFLRKKSAKGPFVSTVLSKKEQRKLDKSRMRSSSIERKPLQNTEEAEILFLNLLIKIN